MADMQRTLDGRLVPVGPHRDDLVECSDGTMIRRGDIEFVDCRGVVHSNEDDKQDANDDIVRELLDAHDEWIGDYVSSTDYGDNYIHLVMESCHSWRNPIGEWLDIECPNLSSVARDIILDALREAINEFDIEGEYDRSEYSRYHGSGICLDSIEVGEYESQIDIESCPEFIVLHKNGELEDCLANYNGDLYISRNGHYDRDAKQWVKTSYVSGGDYPHFYGYSNGWGQWHFVISEERINELLSEVCIDYSERHDG